MASKDSPKVVRLDIEQRPGQPDATLVVWPTGNPSAVTGPGVPSVIPGGTDAPSSAPNIAKPSK